MITYKQLEAIYWITRAGSFAQAADELHTTQSAISKRVKELEQQFGTALSDRSTRTARLTARGERMYQMAAQLLQQRDAAVEQFARAEVLQTRIRIGITELTAMTWLPQLVLALQEAYPKVVIEPDIDTSASLKEKLLKDQVDLMIVPDVFGEHEDAQLDCRLIGKVELAWMCKPGTIPTQRVLRLKELVKHRLLIQGLSAGTGMVYKRWLRTMGVQPTNLIVCNSLVGRIALTVSGLGVSYLPEACMETLVASGQLETVPTTQALPPYSYVAAFKRDRSSALVAAVTELAVRSCDFSRMVQMRGANWA